MHSLSNLGLIKSHHTTTNVYVQKHIIQDNIGTLQTAIKNYHSLGLSNFQVLELRNLVRSQNHILEKLNASIRDIEQGSFPFGNPCI